MEGTKKKYSFKKAWNKKWKYVLFMLPNLFLLALLKIYPNIKVFPMSLYEWSPISSRQTYVGFRNFQMLFQITREETLRMIGNTLIYVIALFVIQTVLALSLSLALQKNTGRNKFFRTYFFLPMVFSTSMVTLTWQFMYDPNLGIINNILGALGVEGFPGTYFFKGSVISMVLVVIVHVWAKLGYPLSYFMSGLNTISADLGEAAVVDGANSWQIFYKITLPLLLPTISRVTMLTLTTGVLTADFVVMMGIGSQRETLASYVYNLTLKGTDYGLVSALGVVLFFILMLLTFIQFVAVNKIEKSIYG